MPSEGGGGVDDLVLWHWAWTRGRLQLCHSPLALEQAPLEPRLLNLGPPALSQATWMLE